MAAPVPPLAELRRIEWRGLTIVIETEAGAVREWTRPDGSIGRTRIELPYGYIDGVEGSDGDELDCYVGRDPEAKFVYVVHQLTPAGKRDEDKCFLDVATAGAAEAFFLQHRDDGDAAYGGMSAIPVDAFLAKLKRRTGTGKIRHGRMETTMPVRSFHGIAGADLRGFAGRVQAFDATDATGNVRVGVWDRFATFGEGDQGLKVKEGEAVAFNPETFAKMVDNWAARGQQLTMCLDHRSALGGIVEAPAAALYDAIAVVGEDGKTLHIKSVYGKTIAAPDAATLIEQCAKYPPPLSQPGGMWGYRAEITPKGQHPTEGLANFRGISPLFVMNGVDEQERPIGPVLFDVAAVNVNFQGGCELTLGALTSLARMSAAESALHDAAPIGERKPVAMADEGASIATATDTQLANRVKRLGSSGGIPSAEYTEIAAELKRRGINTFPQLQARTGVQFAADAADRPLTALAAPADGITVKCPDCGREVKVNDGRYAVHTTGDGGVTCSESNRNVSTKFSAAPSGNGAVKMAATGTDANGNPVSVGDQVEAIGGFAGGAKGVVEFINYDGSEIRIRSGGPGGDVLGWKPTKNYRKMFATLGASGAVEGANSMNPEMMKRMGFADGAQPTVDEKMSKFAAHAMGEASPEDCKAMAEDLDKHEEPAAKAMAVKLRKMAAVEPHGEPDGDELHKMAEAADLKPVGMSRTAIFAGVRERLVAMRATTVPREDVKILKDEIATLKQRNAVADEAECDGAIVAFARGAIADGRWDPDGQEALVALARASVDTSKAGKAKAAAGTAAAEKHLKPKGFWTVMSNFTANGHPVGKGHTAEDFTSGNASASAAEVEYKAEIAKVMEADKVTHAVAMSRVAKAKPQLIAALRK